MTLWHLEPILEEIQVIDKSNNYFDLLDEICLEHLGLSLGDLETLSIPRLSLFLLDHAEVDVSKALIAHCVLEKLIEFEDNIFCAAMYRRKNKDLNAIIVDISQRHNLGLERYLAS